MNTNAKWAPDPGITLGDIPGVRLGVASAGLYGERDDIALVIAPGTAAAVVTKSSARAACCNWTRARVPGPIQAIITNAGNANAATGPQGVKHVVQTAERVAEWLKCTPDSILVCSTGVIGVPLPIDKVLRGAKQAAINPSATTEAAARAIMTTDTAPKMAGCRGPSFQVAGIAKGSGMIHPNMATMLATVATNAAVEGDALQALLTRCVEQSFNAISVDGDCSTNDTVILVATGQGNAIVPGTDAFATLENAVAYVCQELAKKIARDGEGAKHLIEVVVQGLETDALARKAARAVASSNLVKAAVHGGDPNWGRIVGALGALGVPGLDQASVSICGTTVLNKGVPTPFDERLVSQSMNEPEVRFDIVLTGPGRGMAWGCDLTEEYVKINADYRS